MKYFVTFALSQLSREKRQRRQDVTLNTEANCNFGSALNVGSCEWSNLENVTSLRWRASKGDDAFWIGGPRHDHDDHNSLEGGYVFLETSSLSEGEPGSTRESALIESPLLTSTGSKVGSRQLLIFIPLLKYFGII